MDAVRLKVLQAEALKQLEAIEQVYETLEDRAGQMQANNPGFIESTAYQL